MSMNWKGVVGYEDRYQVSDLDQVKSLKTGRMLKLIPLKKGYLTV